jgi:hypothetical protein
LTDIVPHSIWLNIYGPEHVGTTKPSRQKADAVSRSHNPPRAALLRVDFVDGIVVGVVLEEPTPVDEVQSALLGALDACTTQIEQMRGMFDDSDGTIAQALEDAEDAVAMAKERRVFGALKGKVDDVPDFLEPMSEEEIKEWE